jgi:hypothetical protein
MNSDRNIPALVTAGTFAFIAVVAMIAVANAEPPAVTSLAYTHRLDEMLAADDMQGLIKTLRRCGQSSDELQAGTSWL